MLSIRARLLLFRTSACKAHAKRTHTLSVGGLKHSKALVTSSRAPRRVTRDTLMLNCTEGLGLARGFFSTDSLNVVCNLLRHLEHPCARTDECPTNSLALRHGKKSWPLSVMRVGRYRLLPKCQS